MPELNIVGKALIRPDAYDKATGKTLYVDDLFASGMLYAGILYSSKAHAKIKNIKFDAAIRIPGVVSILTAKDIPGENFIPLIKEDWIFLAEDEVRYIGEPIAVVVVEDKYILDDVLSKIDVEYEDLPAVFDPEESLKPNAPKINPISNLISHHKIRTGDTNKGFSEADVIIESVYQTGYQEHAYIEPQGFLAIPSSDDCMELLGSMQCPFYVHNAISSILGIQSNKVKVVQTPTGGAFGGKEDFPSLFAGITALATYKTGRPVKLILKREDDIIMTSKRHPAKCYYKTGAKKDGTLTACEIKVYLDCGAYATLSPAVSWRCTIHCYGPYRIPNLKVDVFASATNKVPCGAFRGFGTPKVIFAMERQIDKIAKAIDIDPIEIREKNCWRKGDKTGTGQLLKCSVGLPKTISSAKVMSGWSRKIKKYPEIRGTKRRGIGCAIFLYGVGLGAAGKKVDKAAAYLQVKSDGSVIFAVGTTEIGQGMQTVLSQIVAEGLGGIPLEKVQMLDIDTTRVLDSGPTVASRSTYMSGNALLDACKKITNMAKKVAGDLLGCKSREVVIKNGCYSAKSNSKYVTFVDVIRECEGRHLSLSVQGFFDSPPTSWDPGTGQGSPYVTYSYATQIAEVEVDIETGEVKVLNVWAAHDLGKAINPVLATGQIEGGIVQGMAYALMEHLRVDEKGSFLNPSFSTYILPTIADIPQIHTKIIESAYPQGPFGAKGFGETPLMGMAACIANAVTNATGVNITQIPILPENLASLLHSN